MDSIWISTNVHQEVLTKRLKKAPLAAEFKWTVNALSMAVAKTFKATKISNKPESTEDDLVRDSEQEPVQKCTSEMKSAWLN